MCFGERAQQAFIAIKTGGYDENPSVGGDPHCSEAILNIGNRDLRTGVLPERERQICTTPRLIGDMTPLPAAKTRPNEWLRGMSQP